MKRLGAFLAARTLRRKIGFIAIAGVLLAIGGFSYLGLTALDRSTQARLQERLTIARLVADYEDQVLGMALDNLESAARSLQYYESPATTGRELEYLRSSLSQLGFSVIDVFLLDQEGRKVWGIAPWGDGPGGQDPELYPGLQRTISAGTPTVSGLTSVPSSPIPVVLLVSTKQSSGNVLVVAVDVTGASIAGFMRPIELGDTGYAELVDENGLVMTRTSPGRAPSFFEKSDHPGRFASLIASGEPAMGTCHRCHVEAHQIELRACRRT